MRILSILILATMAIAAIEAKAWCRFAGFVKATCRNDYKWKVISGTDGANGKHGKRGMSGVRGKLGRNSRFCGRKIKGRCPPFRNDFTIQEQDLYPAINHEFNNDHGVSPFRNDFDNFDDLRNDFDKLKEEVRWMAKILDLIEGLDIKDMTKEELIKIIISQNDKIVVDHDKMDKMEDEIERLKKKLKDSSNSLAIIENLRKQLKEKIKENAEKDAKIKELNAKIEDLNNNVGGNDKLKQKINQLKDTIEDLVDKLNKVKNKANAFKKLHDQIKKLHEDLKEKTKGLENEVAKLKKQLRKKGVENYLLKNKIEKLEAELAKTRKECDSVKAENEKLLKQLDELKKKCEGHGGAQDAIIAKLKQQIAELKEKCKDIDAHKKRIKELEDKIKALLAAADQKPKFPANQILCSGDESKGVTTISKSNIGIFSKYKKKNIELPCVKASDGSGPWFVLLNRQDGSVNFKRNFKAYQKGFGNQKGEFWLGLDAAHALTSAHRYRLRVELEDHKGNKHYASYKKFKIGRGSGYRLRIGGYKGNIYNALRYHRNQRFSTYDKDQDGTRRRHCAQNSGGWWYKKCHQCLLTGRWSSKWVKKDKIGVRWRARRNKMYTSYYSWKKARMLIQPKYTKVG